jgi:hypothetical protein
MPAVRTRKRTIRRFGLGSRVVRALAAALTLAVLSGAAPAAAESYSSKRSGHPLRILAYVVRPVGVILETLIFRPAHWIASHEPIKTLVGQED